MKLYQKLIIPALISALTYLPGCKGKSISNLWSGDEARHMPYASITKAFTGNRPGQPSILYVNYNSQSLECRVNGEEIPLAFPSGDFAEGSGTYSNLQGQGKHTLTLTALKPCTLKVGFYPIPTGISSDTTLIYSGQQIVSTEQIKAMAKEAIQNSFKSSDDTSGVEGDENELPEKSDYLTEDREPENYQKGDKPGKGWNLNPLKPIKTLEEELEKNSKRDERSRR